MLFQKKPLCNITLCCPQCQKRLSIPPPYSVPPNSGGSAFQNPAQRAESPALWIPPICGIPKGGTRSGRFRAKRSTIHIHPRSTSSLNSSIIPSNTFTSSSNILVQYSTSHCAFNSSDLIFGALLLTTPIGRFKPVEQLSNVP